MAPEVFKKSYNEKCDIWAVGVTAYVLLSGHAPFNGELENDIIKLIKKGKLKFRRKIWEKISDDAKDFIK